MLTTLKTWWYYLCSCESKDDDPFGYRQPNQYYFDELFMDDVGTYQPPSPPPLSRFRESFYYTPDSSLDEPSDPIFRDPPLPQSIFY